MNCYSFFSHKQKRALKRILLNKNISNLFDITYYLVSDRMTKKEIFEKAQKLGLNVGRDRKKIAIYKLNKKIKYIRYLYFNDYYFK